MFLWEFLIWMIVEIWFDILSIWIYKYIKIIKRLFWNISIKFYTYIICKWRASAESATNPTLRNVSLKVDVWFTKRCVFSALNVSPLKPVYSGSNRSYALFVRNFANLKKLSTSISATFTFVRNSSLVAIFLKI